MWSQQILSHTVFECDLNRPSFILFAFCFHFLFLTSHIITSLPLLINTTTCNFTKMLFYKSFTIHFAHLSMSVTSTDTFLRFSLSSYTVLYLCLISFYLTHIFIQNFLIHRQTNQLNAELFSYWNNLRLISPDSSFTVLLCSIISLTCIVNYILMRHNNTHDSKYVHISDILCPR